MQLRREKVRGLGLLAIEAKFAGGTIGTEAVGEMD
jgi:hypothetical protein